MKHNGTHVTWRQLIFLAVIITGVLGTIWIEVTSNGEDITEIKVDVAVTKEVVNNLIDKIDKGEVSIQYERR